MANQIYVVDPNTHEPVKAGPVSFRDIGITERDDLQRWVANDPGLLGEPLLVVSSEFSGFDKSNRRLDILALDADAHLVVVELKLDAGRSLADQQAIRYAALCSAMTIDDVVAALARFEGSTEDEASARILEFLHSEELPELRGHPRIILAAGSIEDKELTNCVLWLRGFGMDISCVELTPYCTTDFSQVVLVPRTIIPTHEAPDYTIGVSREQAAPSDKQSGKAARARFWRWAADEFNRLDARFRSSGRASGVYMCVRFGSADIHYEWIVRRREKRLDTALHFEFDDRQESLQWLEVVRPHVPAITKDIGLQFELVPWGRRWAEARFRLPYSGDFPDPEIAPYAARLMCVLIERTWPLIEPHLKT